MIRWRVLLIEAGARPDTAPRDLGDEALEVGVESGRVRLCPGHVLVPKDRPADSHAALEHVIGHVRDVLFLWWCIMHLKSEVRSLKSEASDF